MCDSDQHDRGPIDGVDQPLVAYGRALTLLGRPAPALWFHFPLAGVMIEVVAKDGAA